MPAPPWARLANTTIAKYLKGDTPAILRNRKLPAMLEDKGRITMGHSGTSMVWRIRYRRSAMQTYGDMVTVTFARQNKYKTAELDWRSYIATDSITKMEKEQNKGAQAIVRLIDEVYKTLKEDIQDNFADTLYTDGNAAGYTLGIHGLNSWTGVSGANASQPIGTPSDTYAGLTTGLGDYGGAASSGSTWPSGTFDANYDFFSPLVVDYTSAVAAASGGWNATTKTWPNTCIEALRYGILYQQKNKGKRGMLDMILLADRMYRDFKDANAPKERLVVQRGDGDSGLYKLGFRDIINLDGVDITSEYGVPVTEGHGIPLGMLELCSLQKELFVTNPVDHDPSTQSDRYSVDFMGNMKNESPRHSLKFDNVS